MPVSPDARIGTELGPYRIERVLGRGGMSVVYLAEHVSLRRKVALKLLAPELAEDERFRARFLRESRLAASLDHPNVIPIYEADEADGHLYISMRYVAGTDLRSLLREEASLDPARAVDLLVQVAGALDAAHARGLVHRDVKPANILIAAEPAGHVYLSDFGLTKNTGSYSGLSMTGQLVGTIDYVAPEQIQGDPVDHRADIYSFGCVLYESLAGEPPFRRGSDLAVLWAHVQDEPPPLAANGFSAEIDDVLARALAKEPDERYSTCRELVGAAADALDVPTPAHPVARPPLARGRTDEHPGREREDAAAATVHRRGRRLRLLVAAVASMLMLATAAAVALVARSDREAPKSVSVLPNSVAVIDPRTRDVVANVRVGTVPASIAVGDGAAWVLNAGDRTISRIDAKRRMVVSTIGAGSNPVDVEVGGGAVWVLNAVDNVVLRVNPESNAVEQRIRLPVPPDDGTGVGESGVNALAYGSDSIWASGTVEERGTVFRIDAQRNKLVASIRLAISEGGGPIATGFGAVWVAGWKSVVRIDPSTNRVVARIPILRKGGLAGIAAGEEAVWVTDEIADANDGLVWRLDPAVDAVARSISAPGAPAAVAVGSASVWVASGIGESVLRIDPSANRVVEKIPVRSTPTGIAVGQGAVWVAVS